MLPSYAQDFTNGIGHYQEFGNTTLLIKLDLDSSTALAETAMAQDSKKRLSFLILKDRSARSLIQLLTQNLSINNQPDQIESYTQDLMQLPYTTPPTLLNTDILTFHRVSDNLTQMSLNEIQVAEFNTAGFFDFLLSAFIGSVPPSSELKAGLLNEGNVSADDAFSFNTNVINQARHDDILAWLARNTAPQPAAVARAATPPPAPSAPARTAASTPQAVAETVNIAPAVAPIPQLEAEPTAQTEVEPTAQAEADLTDALAPENETVQASLDEEQPQLVTEPLSKDYQDQLSAKIYSNVEYPQAAMRRGREGSLRIALLVHRDGSVSDITLTQTAEYGSLNEAALEAVAAAAPFENIPSSISNTPLLIEVPIQFRLP